MTAIQSFFKNPVVSRLLACLFGGFVLALIVGPQEGTQADFGYAFRQAVAVPRIFVFLGIGFLLFLILTFRSYITPYLTRPGIRPLGAAFLTLVVSHALLHWFDPLGDGKFRTVATAVAQTPGASTLTSAYFGWLAWTIVLLIPVLGLVAIIVPLRWLGWVIAVISAFGAYAAWEAHADVEKLGGGIDHSLGAGIAVLGYLAALASGIEIAMTKSEVANTSAFTARVMSWRPGFPLAVLGAVTGLLGLGVSTWWSPGHTNLTIGPTSDLFAGSGLNGLATAYIGWLGWVLFLVVAVLGLAACYLRNAALGLAAAVLGLISLVLTIVTMYQMSSLGGRLGVDGSTGAWQNLGTGGWITSAAFLILAGAGFTAGYLARKPKASATVARSSDVVGKGVLRSPGGIQTFFVLIAAVALFYPPTASTFWQQVLVSEIGIYVLLAVGLNVVVGWAGLLDLGFIAFYAIGSYVTAYVVGSLPVKPPSWLHMSPLLAIPFAILLCLIAGVALGAPTLRLRGDYLAIVTLGFGEIIRIAAINADGLTNSTRGPQPQVPHPVVDIGIIRIQWGLNQLQYWYLLLVITVIVVILFHKLENSRTGRAWAAIREDEIAAQASGVNTTRVKLMAFAIGASTSGVAGVFFASQIGYFNPDNFILANSILVVAYVVFGGMGSLPGAMAGAAVLTWLPQFLRDQVPPEDKQIWIGLIILLMMIFRPAGLIPARRRQAELRGLHGAPSGETRAVAANEGMGADA